MYKPQDCENLITSKFLEKFLSLILTMRGHEKEEAENISLRLSLFYLDILEMDDKLFMNLKYF
jgi:hypothetical protein